MCACGVVCVCVWCVWCVRVVCVCVCVVCVCACGVCVCRRLPSVDSDQRRSSRLKYRAHVCVCGGGGVCVFLLVTTSI